MDFSSYGKGKCINCGFLCKRSQPDLGCYEANADARQSGNLSSHAVNIVGVGHSSIAKLLYISTFPWCFVGKANFIQECTDIRANANADFDKVREIITRDRNCSSWYPWREFLSPKEHLEEFKMLALEQRRQEFEFKLQELNEQARKRSDRVMRWLAIAAIVFAIAEVVAALLGITSDSWILSLFR